MLGFNNTPTLVGHFMFSLREREKRDRRDIREDEREGQARKTKMNESEETEVIKTFPILTSLQALSNCKPISVGCPSNIRYTTRLPHPTTPLRKHAYSDILRILPPKQMKTFRRKILVVFILLPKT